MRKINIAPQRKATSRINGDAELARRKVLQSSASFGELADAWAAAGVEGMNVMALFSDYVLGEGVNNVTLQIAQRMESIAGPAFYHELLHDSGVHDLYIYAVCWVGGVISSNELKSILPHDKFLAGILQLPVYRPAASLPRQQNFFDFEEY